MGCPLCSSSSHCFNVGLCLQSLLEREQRRYNHRCAGAPFACVNCNVGNTTAERLMETRKPRAGDGHCHIGFLAIPTPAWSLDWLLRIDDLRCSCVLPSNAWIPTVKPFLMKATCAPCCHWNAVCVTPTQQCAACRLSCGPECGQPEPLKWCCVMMAQTYLLYLPQVVGEMQPDHVKCSHNIVLSHLAGAVQGIARVAAQHLV